MTLGSWGLCKCRGSRRTTRGTAGHGSSWINLGFSTSGIEASSFAQPHPNPSPAPPLSYGDGLLAPGIQHDFPTSRHLYLLFPTARIPPYLSLQAFVTLTNFAVQLKYQVLKKILSFYCPTPLKLIATFPSSKSAFSDQCIPLHRYSSPSEGRDSVHSVYNRGVDQVITDGQRSKAGARNQADLQPGQTWKMGKQMALM